MYFCQNDPKSSQKHEKSPETENSADFRNKITNLALIHPLKDLLLAKVDFPNYEQCFYPIEQLLKFKSLSQIEMRANCARLHYESLETGGVRPFSFLDPILNPNEKVLVFHGMANSVHILINFS